MAPTHFDMPVTAAEAAETLFRLLLRGEVEVGLLEQVFGLCPEWFGFEVRWADSSGFSIQENLYLPSNLQALFKATICEYND